MDALKTWMIIHFTPYQTTTRQKWMFSKNFCSDHPCCYSKLLGQHSSTFTKQQRRPLLPLLSLSFSQVEKNVTRFLNVVFAQYPRDQPDAESDSLLPHPPQLRSCRSADNSRKASREIQKIKYLKRILCHIQLSIARYPFHEFL